MGRPENKIALITGGTTGICNVIVVLLGDFPHK